MSGMFNIMNPIEKSNYVISKEIDEYLLCHGFEYKNKTFIKSYRYKNPDFIMSDIIITTVIFYSEGVSIRVCNDKGNPVIGGFGEKYLYENIASLNNFIIYVNKLYSKIDFK